MIHASNDSWFTGLRRHRRFYMALLTCVVALACLKPAALLAIEGYRRLTPPIRAITASMACSTVPPAPSSASGPFRSTACWAD